MFNNTFLLLEFELIICLGVSLAATIFLPPIIYLFQVCLEILSHGKTPKWWQSLNSFAPTWYWNVSTMTVYVACIWSGKLFARWMLNRPLYKITSYTYADAFQLVVFLLALDLISYWIHRFQHHPLVYKYSHQVHHSVKYVGIWSSFYANPLDYLSTSFPLPYLMHLCFDIHWYTDIIISLVSTMSLVIIHSEYKHISTGHHNIHHLDPRFNLSGMSPWLDQLFGTYLSTEKMLLTRKLK